MPRIKFESDRDTAAALLVITTALLVVASFVEISDYDSTMETMLIGFFGAVTGAYVGLSGGKTPTLGFPTGTVRVIVISLSFISYLFGMTEMRPVFVELIAVTLLRTVNKE